MHTPRESDKFPRQGLYHSSSPKLIRVHACIYTRDPAPRTKAGIKIKKNFLFLAPHIHAVYIWMRASRIYAFCFAIRYSSAARALARGCIISRLFSALYTHIRTRCPCAQLYTKMLGKKKKRKLFARGMRGSRARDYLLTRYWCRRDVVKFGFYERERKRALLARALKLV